MGLVRRNPGEVLDALDLLFVVFIRQQQLESVACVHQGNQDDVTRIGNDIVQDDAQDPGLRFRTHRAVGGGIDSRA